MSELKKLDDSAPYNNYSYDPVTFELYYSEKEKQPVRIANHTPIACRKYIFIDGINEDREQIEFTLNREGKESEYYKTTAAVIRDTKKPFADWPSDYRLDIEPVASKAYSNLLQEMAADTQAKLVYQQTGFHKINDNLVFLNQHRSITKDGSTDQYTVELPELFQNYLFEEGNLTDEEARRVIELLFHSANSEVLLPTFSFLIATIIDYGLTDKEFVREHRGGVNFSLYLHGKTGIRKTSFVNTLLNCFGVFHYESASTMNFDSTDSADQYILYLAKNLVVYRDDKKPAMNKEERENYRRKQKEQAKSVSDGVKRIRANIDGTLRKSYPPNAKVIVTGENDAKDLSQSERARQLVIEMHDNSVNKGPETELGKKGKELNLLTQMFIQWYISNYVGIRQAINTRYDENKTVFKGLKLHERLYHTGALLLTSWETWVAFLKYMHIDLEEEICKKEYYQAVFQRVMLNQGKDGNELEPIKIALKYLLIGIENNRLYFPYEGDDPKNRQISGYLRAEGGKQMLLFECENLLPDLDAFVEKQTGVLTTLTLGEFKKELNKLCHRNPSMFKVNESGRCTLKYNGRRYYAIYKEKLIEYVGGEENEERRTLS